MPPASPAPPASLTSSLALLARFSVKPRVGEKPPVLTVTVTNRTAQAVPMVRFSDPRCVVQYLLDLKIRKPDGKPLALRSCAVLSWPGTDGTLGPQESERFTVPLAELAEKWPPGTYAIDVDWDPAAVNKARGVAVPGMIQSSLDATEFSVAKALAKVRVKRGETVTLPDGVRFTFSGHSHKDVGKDDSSPLVIGGKIATGAGAAKSFYVNVHPETERLFDEGGRTFELVAYAYDEWMELRYFGKLAPRP